MDDLFVLSPCPREVPMQMFDDREDTNCFGAPEFPKAVQEKPIVAPLNETEEIEDAMQTITMHIKEMRRVNKPIGVLTPDEEKLIDCVIELNSYYSIPDEQSANQDCSTSLHYVPPTSICSMVRTIEMDHSYVMLQNQNADIHTPRATSRVEPQTKKTGSVSDKKSRNMNSKPNAQSAKRKHSTRSIDRSSMCQEVKKSSKNEVVHSDSVALSSSRLQLIPIAFLEPDEPPEKRKCPTKKKTNGTNTSIVKSQRDAFQQTKDPNIPTKSANITNTNHAQKKQVFQETKDRNMKTNTKKNTSGTNSSVVKSTQDAFAFQKTKVSNVLANSTNVMNGDHVQPKQEAFQETKDQNVPTNSTNVINGDNVQKEQAISLQNYKSSLPCPKIQENEGSNVAINRPEEPSQTKENLSVRDTYKSPPVCPVVQETPAVSSVSINHPNDTEQTKVPTKKKLSIEDYKSRKGPLKPATNKPIICSERNPKLDATNYYEKIGKLAKAVLNATPAVNQGQTEKISLPDVILPVPICAENQRIAKKVENVPVMQQNAPPKVQKISPVKQEAPPNVEKVSPGEQKVLPLIKKRSPQPLIKKCSPPRISPSGISLSSTSSSSDSFFSNSSGYSIEDRKREEYYAAIERRILYVGGLTRRTSRQDLIKRFQVFGKITDVKLCSRHPNDNRELYGFVTFKESRAAYEALEKGNYGNFPTYNIRFGGTRHFCQSRYVDLDAPSNFH